MAYKEKDQKELELIQKVVSVVAKREMQDGITLEELEKYGTRDLKLQENDTIQVWDLSLYLMRYGLFAKV